jgi:hypothetical protein
MLTRNNTNKTKRRMENFISRCITIINIKRNHSKKTGFFIVNVPEVKQYGLGFRFYIKGNVYGFSLHNNTNKTK